MNDTLQISRSEYTRLQRYSKAYQKLARQLFELVIADPIETVVDDFRKTNLYSDAFLADLENGLKKSSYGKR